MPFINMIIIYYSDKKLKKGLHVLGAEKKNIDFNVSSSKDTFLQDVFQMTVIALVTVINHYHINGLHLFWDTLYLTHSSGNNGVHTFPKDICPKMNVIVQLKFELT